jgi:hypothetical protein
MPVENEDEGICLALNYVRTLGGFKYCKNSPCQNTQHLDP